MRKFVRKEAAEIAIEEAAPINISGGPEVTELALGESGTDNRVRPVDLSLITDHADPLHRPLPEFLRESVLDLSKIQTVQAKLLTQSEEDGWTIPVPIVADEDGVIEQRLFIYAGADRPSHLRRLAAFSVCRGDDTTEAVSLIVVESETLWWRLYGAVTDADSCARLLRHAALDFATATSSEQDTIQRVLSWVLSPDA